jgi:hypothetical protein
MHPVQRAGQKHEPLEQCRFDLRLLAQGDGEASLTMQSTASPLSRILCVMCCNFRKRFYCVRIITADAD